MLTDISLDSNSGVAAKIISRLGQNPRGALLEGNNKILGISAGTWQLDVINDEVHFVLNGENFLEQAFYIHFFPSSGASND